MWSGMGMSRSAMVARRVDLPEEGGEREGERGRERREGKEEG